MTSAIIPLKLGGAVAHLSLSGTTEELGRARQSAIESKPQIEGLSAGLSESGYADLALVEQRCRLKAASCRLHIERHAAAPESEAELDARHRMDEMIRQARATPSCFLWVFWRERQQPDDGALARIAENYDAHADAAALMRRIDESGERVPPVDEVDALHLLAEANSALRVAMEGTWLTKDDGDQADIHFWLRRETAARQIRIDRHMTMDDPADPACAADLRERIRQLAQRLDDRAGKAKGIKSALNQIRYHAAQVVRNGPDGSAPDWAKIADALAKLAGMGIAPSDRRIGEAIGAAAAALCPVPALDEGGLGTAIAHARELSARAAYEVEEGPSADPPGREWSKPVVDVRALLRGKRIVIIGGERKAEAVARFVDAFELADAEWVPLTEHGPGTPMRGPIARADTGAVVVIVKLTGHLHVDEAKEYALAAGKPCVLLTGGYNPEQVANAILEQASVRLKR